jgi:hypothetical protein
MELSDLRLAILTGTFDDSLDLLVADLQDRKRRTAPKATDFSVGDTVKYVPAVRPKYLAGAVGKITKINRTKVVVRLDTPVGRFAGNITTPTNLIEKV